MLESDLSPKRVGRITGSRVGPVLGHGPYQSRDDVMRSMVRQFFGASQEFTGNEFTSYGTDHEDVARTDYERETGALVTDAQDFIVHPVYDFLGVSPDGLVGVDGCIEIKCPSPYAKWRSIDDKPGYYDQVQLTLACTDRNWCDFIMWRDGEPLFVEQIEVDPGWLPKHLSRLQGFINEYRRITADRELAAPFLEDAGPVERDDPAWALEAESYLAALRNLEAAKLYVDVARERLTELAGGRSSQGAGVSLSITQRQGQVDWKKLASKHAPDADPDEFRRPASVVTTVRVVKDES